MELAIASLVTIGTEVFKFLLRKFPNKKLLKSLTVIFAFFASIVGVFIWKYIQGELSINDFQSIAEAFFIAVGYYEVGLKRVIRPILERVKDYKFN